MFKFVIVLVLTAYSVNAGVISTGLVGDGYGLGGLSLGAVGISHGVVAAPAVAVAHAPAVATSYQNNNQLSLHPTLVATKVAAPIAVAHAPIAVAHAPIAVAHGSLGYGGLGLSLH